MQRIHSEGAPRVTSSEEDAAFSDEISMPSDCIDEPSGPSICSDESVNIVLENNDNFSD